ncbi:MAG: septum formation initiator family protein [Thermoleophilia bacterium]|nr:septum formation initiator family protein [Thermoleophilia bacterium]
MAVFASYAAPVRAYIERSRQIEQEKAATAELQTRHQQLLVERDRLQDQRYVEQVARRDLGLVRPGEQSFVVKDLGGEAEAGLPEPRQDPSLPERIRHLLGRLDF